MIRIYKHKTDLIDYKKYQTNNAYKKRTRNKLYFYYFLKEYNLDTALIYMFNKMPSKAYTMYKYFFENGEYNNKDELFSYYLKITNKICKVCGTPSIKEICTNVCKIEYINNNKLEDVIDILAPSNKIDSNIIKYVVYTVEDVYLHNNNKGICDICGDNTNFISMIKGYSDICSSIKCKNKKVKNTSLKKYGVENVMKLEEYKDKIKKTTLEKYGVSNYNKTDECKDKTKQTNIEKYGVEHYMSTDDFKEKSKKTNFEKYGVEHYNNGDKAKQTNIEKYGVENVMELQEYKDKIKDTKMERYGDEHYSNIDKSKTTKLEKYGNEFYNNGDKAKETNIEKYGVYYTQTDEFSYKSKTTKMERYGDEHYSNIDKSKTTKLEKYGNEFYNNGDKAKETNIEKYGVENVMKLEEYKDKAKLTNMERYGENYYTQTDEYKDKTKKTTLERYGVENVSKKHLMNMESFTTNYIKANFIDKDNKLLLEDAMEFYNCSNSTIYQYLAKNNIDYNRGNYAEKELLSLVDDSIHNDRKLIKPYEIDVLSHVGNFGIEYNGILWHSYGKTFPSNYEEENPNNHLDKTNLVEGKGYQLFHIFENEWITKQQIWKSVLNSKMNKTTRIYGRKTTIKEVDNKTKKKFLDNNHLQGSCNSSKDYGLYYNDELVSLMTFGKTRFSKNYEWELIRFCNKINTTVVGGASKLLKHFERENQPNSLVSYANRRWSTGGLYKAIGFEHSHNSTPNYFYFNKGSMVLESRNKYQKHKLSKVLEDFNPKETERENMFCNGYRRIWDSGNMVFTKAYID